MRLVLFFISVICLAGCGKLSELRPDPMQFFHPDGRVIIAKQIVKISNPPEMAGWGYDFFAWEIAGKDADISRQVSADIVTHYYVWSKASLSEPCHLGIEACKKWDDYSKIATSVNTILKSDDALVCFESYRRSKIDQKLEFWMWLCSPKQKLIAYVGVKE